MEFQMEEDQVNRRKRPVIGAVPRASMRPGFCINNDGKRAEPPDYLCPECKEKLNSRFSRIFSELDQERTN